MLQIVVGNDSFTLADEEVKALETDMISVFEWIKNAIENKARKTVDFIITEKTDRQAKKVPKAEKLALIKDMDLPTVIEKNATFENETKSSGGK